MKTVIQSVVLGTVLLTSGVLMVGCAGDGHSRSTGEIIDDTGLKTKIKAALVNDPEVAGMSIDVKVDRGDVQLGGWVKNASERKKAEDITWGVKGVRSVKNNLEIK
jgi:hyperosmotically inducible protein